MKHRRGPFSEDVHLSRDPQRMERERILNQRRARSDTIRARAVAAGLSPDRIGLLLGMPPEQAEQILERMSPGRRLRDLSRAERLRATCTANGCRHRGWVDLDRRRWGHILLSDIAARLVCAGCGVKGAVKLEIGPGWPRG